MSEKVAILGASDKPERYAHKALTKLKKHNHQVFLVSRNLTEIEGQKVYAQLTEIPEKIDTLSMYVNPKISSELTQDILTLNPKRVIFNPGTENPALEKTLTEKGIKCIENCTLIMLNSNQF